MNSKIDRRTRRSGLPESYAPFLSAKGVASMPSRVFAAQSWIETSSHSREVFQAGFNKHSFLFTHRLEQHPLLQMPELRNLVKDLAGLPGRLYYNTGTGQVPGGWDINQNASKTAEEAFDSLEESKAWMILKSVQSAPGYAELLHEFTDELHGLIGLCPGVDTYHPVISIIVSSPGRVTPYHMDGECNYLVQIRGDKSVSVFDGTDRDIVTDNELELFWTGNLNAAVYKPDTQPRATRYLLTPGSGVHVPITFPHWVQTHDTVSVSVSFNFELVDRSSADLYRANYRLRKLGWNPNPPNSGNKFADRGKLLLMRSIRGYRELLGRGSRRKDMHVADHH